MKSGKNYKYVPLMKVLKNQQLTWKEGQFCKYSNTLEIG